MKRFWLVLLALGLVMAFSASVFAADVKFSGSYYAAGMYQNETSFVKDSSSPSTAFYYQRLRVQMEFIATPALKLVTRFDAMERLWGGTRSAASGVGEPDSYGSRNENENIAFDYCYVWYASKVGIFSVGIMSDGAWGTAFGNNDTPEAKIAWMMVKMPFIMGFQVVKLTEHSRTIIPDAPYGAQTDVDADKYQGYIIYRFKQGAAGVLAYYVRNACFRPLASFTVDVYGALPYIQAKFGPVAIEAEGHYQGGERDYEAGGDIDYESWYAYADALLDLGMFYVGGTVAYVSGDNDPTDDKIENNLTKGMDWNPMLLMFNWDRAYWAGNIGGYGTTAMAGDTSNLLWLGLRGGVRPIADLDICASFAYAEANETATGWDDEYGYELDVTATYKITNNLSYMLGAGYFWTGDYYKAGVAGADVDDNFIVLNKLTLTF